MSGSSAGTMSGPDGIEWREHGVRVLPGSSLDPDTSHTPVMNRAGSNRFARMRAQKPRTVMIPPMGKPARTITANW